MNKVTNMFKGMKKQELYKSFETTYNYFSSLFEDYDGIKYINKFNELQDLLDEAFYLLPDGLKFQPVKYNPMEIFLVDALLDKFEDFWVDNKDDRLSEYLLNFAKEFTELLDEIVDNLYNLVTDIIIEFQNKNTVGRNIVGKANKDTVEYVQVVYDYLVDCLQNIESMKGIKSSKIDNFCFNLHNKSLGLLIKGDSDKVPYSFVKLADDLLKLTKTDEYKLSGLIYNELTGFIFQLNLEIEKYNK